VPTKAAAGDTSSGSRPGERALVNQERPENSPCPSSCVLVSRTRTPFCSIHLIGSQKKEPESFREAAFETNQLWLDFHLDCWRKLSIFLGVCFMLENCATARTPPQLIKFGLAAVLALALSACHKPASYKANGPFPICYKTGKSYTQHELIDRAVQSFTAHHMLDDCRKYSSVEEFYRANPRCCRFEPNVTPRGEPLLTNERFGKPVGTLRINYFCGFDNGGKYRDYEAVLTSCGLLLFVSEGSEKARTFYDYPP
jgi:hypothetical protein